MKSNMEVMLPNLTQELVDIVLELLKNLLMDKHDERIVKSKTERQDESLTEQNTEHPEFREAEYLKEQEEAKLE
jgi:hypothetical protein